MKHKNSRVSRWGRCNTKFPNRNIELPLTCKIDLNLIHTFSETLLNLTSLFPPLSILNHKIGHNIANIDKDSYRSGEWSLSRVRKRRRGTSDKRATTGLVDIRIISISCKLFHPLSSG